MYRSGIFNFRTIEIWGRIILRLGELPSVHYKLSRSILSTHPLDASSILPAVTVQHVSRHCHYPLGRKNHPQSPAQINDGLQSKNAHHHLFVAVHTGTNFLKSDFESRLWKAIIKIFKIFALGRERILLFIAPEMESIH